MAAIAEKMSGVEEGIGGRVGEVAAKLAHLLTEPLVRCGLINPDRATRGAELPAGSVYGISLEPQILPQAVQPGAGLEITVA